jgi:hypothetical protein
MARPDFFGKGGRPGSGARSASAGRAVAVNVEPSDSLSCAVFDFVEAAADFCEFSLGVLVVFLGAGSDSAAKAAEGADAAADCECACGAVVLAEAVGAGFVAAFSGAIGEA